MHTLYVLVRSFPFWAIPLAIVIAELGLFFRRKKNGFQYNCWVLVVVILIMVVLWIGFRGDLNSDRWVKEMFQS